MSNETQIKRIKIRILKGLKAYEGEGFRKRLSYRLAVMKTHKDTGQLSLSR
jgi:hypothetical protein